jgi:protein-S-isoprenylcysteine O-methyltransferase Ste14
LQHIVMGLMAFLLAPAFELVSIKGVRGGKQIIGLASLGLWGLAIRGVCADPRRFAVSTWLSVLAWITLVLSAMLLFYSLFIEIPFKQTYHSPGSGQQLVTTGTYALTRHPGVLWFAVLMPSLAVVSGSRLALLATPVWVAADVLYAWVQDRYLFPAMFPGYEEYRQVVPMLTPTRASLRRCLRTIRLASDEDTPSVLPREHSTRDPAARGSSKQTRRV